jgi:hypothetical protein
VGVGCGSSTVGVRAGALAGGSGQAPAALEVVEVFAAVASVLWRRALEPLVAACHQTPLRRFFSYTSVNQLHFAQTAWPFAGIQDAYVTFSDTGDYEVRRGDGERWRSSWSPEIRLSQRPRWWKPSACNASASTFEGAKESVPRR